MLKKYSALYTFEEKQYSICSFWTIYNLEFVQDAIPIGKDCIGCISKDFVSGEYRYTVDLSFKFLKLIHFLEKELQMKNLQFCKHPKLAKQEKLPKQIFSDIKIKLHE